VLTAPYGRGSLSAGAPAAVPMRAARWEAWGSPPPRRQPRRL